MKKMKLLYVPTVRMVCALRSDLLQGLRSLIIMVPTRALFTGVTLLAAATLHCGEVGAFVLLPSQGITQRNAFSALHLTPKGCAARPFEKKKVAIFGAGGYLGAVIFGFLQRASSL